MMLRTINCYLYDSEATAYLLQGVIRFVQARSLMNVVLQKSWTYGFHVKVTYPAADGDNGLESTIRQLAFRYSRPRGHNEYAKFETVIRKVAELEDYAGEYLPLRKDGVVTIEEGEELQHGNPLGSPHVNYEIELHKSQLLVDLYDIWGELSEEQQNIEFAKMFMITVNRCEGGLKFSYLSLRSNFEYFKSQMELTGKYAESTRRNWETLFGRTEEEQQFITHGVQLFAEGSYEREYIFTRMQIFIDCLLSVLSQGYDDGELSLDKQGQGSDLFQYYDAVNDFHWDFYSNTQFLRHYQQKEFVIYQFIVSVLYSLMSLLRVSAIRKLRIIGIVAESVECGFSMSWRDTYLEMSKELVSGGTKQRLVH